MQWNFWKALVHFRLWRQNFRIVTLDSSRSWPLGAVCTLRLIGEDSPRVASTTDARFTSVHSNITWLSTKVGTIVPKPYFFFSFKASVTCNFFRCKKYFFGQTKIEFLTLWKSLDILVDGLLTPTASSSMKGACQHTWWSIPSFCWCSASRLSLAGNSDSEAFRVFDCSGAGKGDELAKWRNREDFYIHKTLEPALYSLTIMNPEWGMRTYLGVEAA